MSTRALVPTVLIVGLAILAWLDLAVLSSVYLAYPGFVDHTEPSVAAISWRLLEGDAVYHGLEDADRTAIPYGPIAYAVHASVFAVLGGGLLPAKVGSVMAALATPLLLLAAWRRETPGLKAGGIIVALGFILYLVPFSIWNRPDPFIAVLVAGAVWAIRSAEEKTAPWGATVLIAVLAGLAVNLKVPSGVFFVPLVLFHCWGRPLRHFLMACGVGLFTVLLPFSLAAFPFDGYVVWFAEQAGGKAFSWEPYGPVLKKGTLYALPLLFFALARRRPESVTRREHVYLWSYVLCLVILLPLAARPGAGSYYYYPFFPLTVDLMLRFTRGVEVRRLAAGLLGLVALVMVLISVPVQKRFWRTLDWERSESVFSEVQSIVETKMDHSMEMGYGASSAGFPSYKLTFYKALLVMAGNPYSLDATVGAEMLRIGVPMPEEALERIRTCRTDLWLVPKGEEPFALKSYYGTPAFSEAFRQAFMGAYQRSESMEHFDIWACRDKG